MVSHDFGPLGQGRHQRRIRGDGAVTGPRIDGRAAPSYLDQPDGNVETLLQEASKMVSDGGKFGHRLRPAWGPRLPPEIVKGEFRDPVHGMEQANPRMPGGRNFSFRLARPSDGPLHVTLARRYPHVAHQDILEDDFVGSPDGQLERSAGSARGKIEAKLAQGIRRGRFRLTAEARRNRLAGIRLAPDVH